MIITLRNSPSQRAAQEQEHLKQAIDHKLKEIEAGYYILLGRLDTEDDEYKIMNTAVETVIYSHATISRRTVEALGAAPAAQQEPAAAPARAGGDLVKLKEGLKPTILTLDFNSQEFQA